MGVGIEEPLENRRFLSVPTAEKFENHKIDCVCATSKKPRIAGLSERPDGVSAVGSLSCTKIEREKFQLVRQIAGVNPAPNEVQRRLDLRLGSTPSPSCKAAQIASQSETRRSLSFSVRGAGFPQKRCGRRSPAFAGDQPNAMLALFERRDFSLCVIGVDLFMLLCYAELK